MTKMSTEGWVEACEPKSVREGSRLANCGGRVDVRTDMRRLGHRIWECDLRVPTCAGMWVGMCVGMCVDMCVDMCIDLCVDMCVNMCVDMCAGIRVARGRTIGKLLISEPNSHFAIIRPRTYHSQILIPPKIQYLRSDVERACTHGGGEVEDGHELAHDTSPCTAV